MVHTWPGSAFPWKVRKLPRTFCAMLAGFHLGCLVLDQA